MSKAARKQPKTLPRLPAHCPSQWSMVQEIRGKLHYFGTDAARALQKYLNERDDLQAGRQPRTTTGLTLAEMVNTYLAFASKRSEAGGISRVTFGDYKWTGGAIVEHFGRTVAPERIRPTEFTSFRNVLAAKYSPSRVGKMVTQTRMMFRWARC